MCGVFGFVARGGKMDMGRLDAIARTTEARGRHAWGMAWLDGDSVLKMFKTTGRISDRLALLRMAKDARFLIGHCRYATQGLPTDNNNNHPHPSDGGWIVHNGMIHDYEELLDYHDFYPTTKCDSEVLGLLIERAKGRRIDRCVEAALSVNLARRAPLVLMGLWKPGRLVIVRNGNPLHVGVTSGGYYFGSLPAGLPGDVRRMKDDSAMEFTRKGVNHASL